MNKQQGVSKLNYISTQYNINRVQFSQSIDYSIEKFILILYKMVLIYISIKIFFRWFKVVVVVYLPFRDGKLEVIK